MKGCQWRIGDGSTVRVWKDVWIPRHKALREEMVDLTNVDNQLIVASLIDSV